MKKFCFIVAAAVVLLFSACANKSANSVDSAETAEAVSDFVIDDLQGITYMNSGVLYYDDYKLSYFDNKSSLSTVLCSDPSCKHEKPTYEKQSDCTAVIDGMNVNSLALIGGKLYFSYGQSGEEFTYKTFFTADVDGSNRKEIAKVAAENIDNTVYTDDSVIVSYSDTLDLTDENATALKERSEWESGIYIIRLSDGNTQQICTHTGSRGKINKLSCDGENIYYLFEYTDGTTTHSQLYKYDTKNQREEELKSFENCYFNGGFNATGALYTQETADGSELHSYSFDGKDTLLAQDESLSNYFYFDEQKIVYGIYETESSHYCLYDSQTGQTEIIGESTAELPIIYAVTDNKIYISTSDGSESSYGIGCLNKDDFASGNFDKAVDVE